LAALADGLVSLAGTPWRLRIVCGIRVVLGYSRNEPAGDERLQVRLQRVSDLLGIDLTFVHIERKGFQIFFFLRGNLDCGLCPLVQRKVFDAVLVCCGDILRKSVELAFWCSAMLGKDIEQRDQRRITDFSAYRFRGRRIVDIESNLILPLRSHAILALSRPFCPDFRPQILALANALVEHASRRILFRLSIAPRFRHQPYIARRANLSQAIHIAEKPNQCQMLCYPASTRGAFRHRHERWKRDAVDAERHEANVATQTAKSCGPGAPGLALSLQVMN
jgi:hypothetical protein